MAVRETNMSSEQKSKEAALQAEGEMEFASRLAQSMDLPSTLDNSITEKVNEKTVEEKVDDEIAEEEQAEEPEVEETPESDESENDSLEEEEDLIPKSKVQKRFDEQTARIKALEAKLARQEQDRDVQTKKDDQESQLEKMSESELKTLKRQVRLEQIKAGSDESKIAQLFDLEEKIDKTLQTAPQRFQGTQVSRFNDAVNETASSIENFEAVKSELFNYAKAIYETTPELHSSVSGQERAWKLAVNHFSALQKISEGKSDTTELKRQVNTLKKKISVDSGSKKAVQQPDSMNKLHKKAVYGTDTDKMNFLKRRVNTDGLVSDEELRNLENLRR